MTDDTSLNEELGVKADNNLVKSISQEIIKSWKFKDNTPKNPVVLLLGGFQGSGKTTVLNILKKEINLLIISPDEIRANLFAKKIPFNEIFVHTVNATKNKLLEEALLLGHNVVVDQLTSPFRIDIARKIIEKEGKDKYRFLTIFLDVSEETLEKRVIRRKELPEVYKGTVGELKVSLEKYGKQDFSLYDLILDSEKMQPEEIAKVIEKKLKRTQM